MANAARRFLVSLASLVLMTGLLPLTLRTTVAQTPSEATTPIVQELLREMDALKTEVNTLRRQEAERQVWEASTLERLPDVNAHLVADSTWSTEKGTADKLSLDACPKLDGCKSGGCGCYPCQCPLTQAPCIDCPRVSTLSPYFNVNIFGAFKLDMLFNSARPVSPGTPFFLFPDSPIGLGQETVDINARQSTVGAAFTGPKMGSFQSGGLIIAMFYNDAVIVDQYGFLPLQAYGELRNQNWRFAAGLQFDVFSPGIPTVLPFSALGGSGNSGNSFRGQVRLERFLNPADNVQWTLQGALSEPITTTIDPEFGLNEDNGWPNFEGRIALGMGCIEGAGLAAKRPFEIGISGVVGQMRTTVRRPDQLPINRVVTDVWGLSTDFRWKMTDCFGVMGELYTGQALGTYNGGILQNTNTVTDEGIRSSGGWLETFFYWTPCLHSHIGYGIDDPIDRDVAVAGRIYNSTVYGNLLWDLNPTFRLGFELAWRETDYKALPDNEGMGFHTQFQWSF